MSLKVKEVNDKNIWERFVLSQSPNIFLQSWHWGEFHHLLGRKTFRLGLYKREELIGVALLIKEKAKRGDYLTCPGGPLLKNWSLENLQPLVDKMTSLGRDEGDLFLRVRPSVLETEENLNLFAKVGFRSAPMHMHAETTWQLDLGPSEEELLSGMRKTTRYCVRRAARDGVEVFQSQKVEDIAVLDRLQQEAVERHKFVPFSREFLKTQFQEFVKDNQAVIFLAEYQKQILSAAMIIFYGDMAVYHYSGTSSLQPKIFSSYLLQWEVIKEAKRRGCRIYNFWGIAPTDDPKHRFAGVTTFKKGFGGKRVDYLHARDYPLSPLYWPTFVFESLRRMRRRL